MEVPVININNSMSNLHIIYLMKDRSTLGNPPVLFVGCLESSVVASHDKFNRFKYREH